MSDPAKATSGPRVLCVAGSPRRGGSTDGLLDAAVEGVVSAGGMVDRLVVAGSDIAPCRGCNACSKTGACIVRDGMQQVFGRIDAADAIIVATPVYFATVPAVLKAFYDRCQPYWARRYVLGEPRRPQRPGGLIVAGGGGDPFGDECAVTTTRSVFGVLSVDLVEVLRATADKSFDLQLSASDLEAAQRLGEQIASGAASAL